MKKDNEKKSVLSGLFIPIALLVLILGYAGYQNFSRQLPSVAKSSDVDDECNSRAYAEIGGPFSLIDQDGKPKTDKDFLGTPTMIYFGYTYCPDICPNSLLFMERTISELSTQNKELAAQIKPVLITIDPARDTKERLKEYVSTPSFPTGLMALTGSEEATSNAAKAFKVAYNKVENKKSPKDYTMDHSSIIYLMGRDGKLKTFFSDQADPKRTAQCIASINKAGL